MKVSVIIPNRNCGPYIAECLDSVIADPAVGEIVIYDDASTDGSPERIEAIGLPQITLIRGTSQVGAYRARTAAVRCAANPIIALLDADDRLAPGSISAGLDVLIEQKLDIAVPAMVRFGDGAEPRPYIDAPTGVVDGQTAFRQTLDDWKIHPMGVLKRELYLSAADRTPEHGYSDDELFARLLLLEAKRVGGSAGVYEYRIVDKPVSTRDRIGRLKTRRGVIGLAMHAGIPAAELGRLTNGFAREALRALPRLSRPERAELRNLAAGLPLPTTGWTLQDRLLRTLIGRLSLGPDS